MDFVQQLKSSVDIISVVRKYVPRLQKRGPRWIGLCPFHSEKTPSFGVHEVHQFYKCFGCGVAGDVSASGGPSSRGAPGPTIGSRRPGRPPPGLPMRASSMLESQRAHPYLDPEQIVLPVEES